MKLDKLGDDFLLTTGSSETRGLTISLRVFAEVLEARIAISGGAGADRITLSDR
jgi:hypothetical protein